MSKGRAKKKHNGLVPLMPILQSLGFCDEGLKTVTAHGAATFREGWRTFPHVGSLASLAFEALNTVDDRRAARCDLHFCWEAADANFPPHYGRHYPKRRLYRTKAHARRALNEITSAEEVERLLYAYALKHGLVPQQPKGS